MFATGLVRSHGHRPMPVLLVAACASTLPFTGMAGDATHPLRGLFCNTEAQLDEALGHMRRKISPYAAVELVNVEDVVCTYVDRLHYLVESPRIIGQVLAEIPLVKYEGDLVGVIVGDNLRPVAPPARVFFVTDGLVPGAVSERRV